MPSESAQLRHLVVDRRSWWQTTWSILRLIGGLTPVAVFIWVSMYPDPIHGKRIELIWVSLALAFPLVSIPLIVDLLGPVARADLLRQSRKDRTIALRIGFVLLLFIIVWINYPSQTHLLRGDEARYAHRVVASFMVAQWLLLVFLVPFFTASAVTEEKERRRVDFLFTTHLRDDEIALGKLLARMVPAFFLLLSGFPVLCMVFLLGGVDGGHLFLGYLATLLSLFMVASLGLLMSVMFRATWQAVLMTFVLLGMWVCCCGMAVVGPLFSMVALEPGQSGNALLAYLVHVAAGSIFCGLALLFLRRMAQRQTAHVQEPTPEEPPQRRPVARLGKAPPLGDHPVEWREVYFSGSAVEIIARRLRVGFVILAFLTVAILMAGGSKTDLNNLVVRLVSTVGATLLVLLTLVRAASRFTVEVEQHTLDALLTIPDRDSIFWAKWKGSFLCLRWTWLVLPTIWLVAVVSRTISPYAVVLLMLATVVFAFFAASLGLWASLSTTSTTRATALAFACAIGIGIGLFLALEFTESPILQFMGRHMSLPPTVIWSLAFSIDPWDWTSSMDRAADVLTIFAAVLGVGFYGVLGVFFLAWARVRFSGLLGPAPLRRGLSYAEGGSVVHEASSVAES